MFTPRWLPTLALFAIPLLVAPAAAQSIATPSTAKAASKKSSKQKNRKNQKKPSAYDKLVTERVAKSRARLFKDVANAAPAAAREGLERAMPLHGADAELLEALLLKSADDPIANARWAHRYAAVVTALNASFKPSGGARRLLPKGGHVERIAQARARATRAIIEWIERRRAKHPSRRLIERWATALLEEITRHAPPLRAAAADHTATWTERGHPKGDKVLAALRRAADQAASKGNLDFAVRAARCLRGFGAQAKFPNLQGPRPTSIGRSVNVDGKIRKLRERLAKNARVTTIADLEAMDDKARRAFGAAHDSMGNPGVCYSPSGRYRIETACGAETLLLAAKTVDHHHARLARWFGSDPFKERPGVIRIVPEAEGLEAEGAPDWWVGGFQRGDETTVRLSWGTPASLGRILTHELTHRFDGHFFPGIPRWLAEGRAVWTSNAYAHTTTKKFVKIHGAFRPIERAFLLGYGGERRLTELIEGTIADPRDNYTAGYALYVYLSSWQEFGKPLYDKKLVKFTKSFRGGRGKAVRRFTKYFCDGRDGRPKNYRAFARKFAEFLRGFYWQDRKDWTARYATVRRESEGRLVEDPPTWSRRRSRAEPEFGQAQARTAGSLLLEAGQRADAAAAWCWALQVDEWEPTLADPLAALLTEIGDQDGAWAVRRETARRYARPADAKAPPFRASLSAVDSLLQAYRTAIKDEKIPAPLRDSFTRRHDRIASQFGAKVLRPERPTGGAALAAMPERIGDDGWIETGLTRYEEKRRRGLWFVDTPDLLVGRDKPRSGTGTAERRAIQRDAFVRTEAWYPRGRYHVRLRIAPLTSYIAGAIILGYERRDRNIRLRFSGGDFLYSIGARDGGNDEHMFERIRVSLGGLRPRSGALWGALPSKRVRFPGRQSSFVIDLLVDGDTCHTWIAKRFVGTFRTLGGAPIEGHLGFAASQGAYRVVAPTLVRDARREAPRSGEAGAWQSAADHGVPPDPPGLSLTTPHVDHAGQPMPITDFRGRAVDGLTPGPKGTIVLWIPMRPTSDRKESNDVGATERFIGRNLARMAERIRKRLNQWRYEQNLVIAIPKGVSEAAKKRAERAVAAHGATLVQHAIPSRKMDPKRRRQRPPTATLLLIDRDRILRGTAGFPQNRRRLPETARRWAKVWTEEAATAK